MTVKRKEELQGILVEDLDGGIEKSDSEKSTVWRVPNREDVVGHLERSSVSESEGLRLELREMPKGNGQVLNKAKVMQRRREERTNDSLNSHSILNHLRPNIRLLHLEVPELDVLIGTSRDHSSLIRSDLNRPDRTGVSLSFGEKSRRGDVVEAEGSGFGSDDDLQPKNQQEMRERERAQKRSA